MGRPPVLLSPPLPPVKVTAGSPLPLPADKLSRSSWPEAGGTGWDGSTLHTHDPWVSCHKENRAFWGGLRRVWSLASLLHLLTLSLTLRDQLTFTPGEVLLSTGHHVVRSTPRSRGNLVAWLLLGQGSVWHLAWELNPLVRQQPGPWANPYLSIKE